MMRAALVCLALFSCNPSVEIGDPSRADGGTMGVVDGGSFDAGSVDAGSQTTIVGGCPRVVLASRTDVSFSADTTSLQNLVISNRLEWRDAPDDALEFTAPTTGRYKVTFSGTNRDLGLSVSDMSGFFTRASCPPAGLVVSIDGWYVTDGMQLSLTQGQSVVFFVSAPYWAMVKTGTYSLRVALEP